MIRILRLNSKLHGEDLLIQVIRYVEYGSLEFLADICILNQNLRLLVSIRQQVQYRHPNSNPVFYLL
jgi:hypothetical protein